jgi:hypothetical protein
MKLLSAILPVALAAAPAFASVITSGTASGPGAVVGFAEWADVTVQFSVQSVDAADVLASPSVSDTMPLALSKYFEYSYTITDQANLILSNPSKPKTILKDFSHIIIGLSQGCASDSECIFGIDPNFSYQVDNYSGSDPSNAGLPGTLYGNKFEPINSATFSVSFFSNRQIDPNGFLYGKGGESSLSNGKLWFYTVAGAVPVPDTIRTDQGDPGGQVPEPGTMGLLGGSLVSLTAWKYRKRRS